MRNLKFIIVAIASLVVMPSLAQDISIFQQFNGRYDYIAIGNTLNPFENNLDESFCLPLESSDADLNLDSDVTVAAAYLYWAGSGTGDTTVTLNNASISADATYTVDYLDAEHGLLTYFSCYADITSFIISEGNTNYSLSDLDITETLLNNIGYCDNRTNFAGWSIYVIYEDSNLPLNQLNLYQGLDIIDRNVQEKTIIIDNLNVVDNVGAKIGFLAWEGDNALNFGESLSINGNVLSNPPLNLSDNAFNGTNTFTNSTTFYNCDLDVYDIQDNINIGDTSATIKMTTGALDDFGFIRADLIIINNIVTVLNSQLPDATITMDSYSVTCGNRTVEIEYTVYNNNSTDVLPANTPIAFYAEGALIAQSATQNEIGIDASEMNSITVSIPENLGEDFAITLVVDDDGIGNGTVTETNETNNAFESSIALLVIPPLQDLPDTNTCNEGFASATFNLIAISTDLIETAGELIYYENITDLETDTNAILMPSSYNNISNPQTIYIKAEADPCYDIYTLELSVENCPPFVPQGFSPNADNTNDWFNIQGLYNIFEQHDLKIFNRYGVLIFEGNNNTPWFGRINRGLNNHGNLVPVGTYYYILNLNDTNYKPILGWVYVNY